MQMYQLLCLKLYVEVHKKSFEVQKTPEYIHVRNNHLCIVSTVGCDNGVVCVYDSMYKTASKDLVHLITSMVYSNLHDMKIVMTDVEKQSNGSDCGVLSIAYAFDICI